MSTEPSEPPTTMSTTYRKLTLPEIEQIELRIKHQDDIDFDDFKERVVALFGPSVATVTLYFGSEYDDEGYSLDCNELVAKDAVGNRLELISSGEDAEEQLADLHYDFSLGAASDEDDSFELTLDLTVAVPSLPDLYVMEVVS